VEEPSLRKYVCLFRLVTASTPPFVDIPIYNDFQTWRSIHIKYGDTDFTLCNSNVNGLRVSSSMYVANKEKRKKKKRNPKNQNKIPWVIYGEPRPRHWSTMRIITCIPNQHKGQYDDLSTRVSVIRQPHKPSLQEKSLVLNIPFSSPHLASRSLNLGRKLSLKSSLYKDVEPCNRRVAYHVFAEQ